MIDVEFYTFRKKLNSTKRPAHSSGQSVPCVLKDPCTMTAPSIELGASMGDPSSWNYAYIDSFDRYYFVNDWEYHSGIWTAALKVDVLATAKDDIEEAHLYVERSSHSFNGNIVDTYYPIKAGPVLVREVQAPRPWASDYQNGTYVLGVIGKNSGVSAGAINYIAMTQARFNALMDNMFEPTHFLSEAPSEWPEKEFDLFRAQFNPMQYIVSCVWFPFAYHGAEGGPLHLGWYHLDGVTYGFNVHDYHFTTSFEIPRHPQAQSAGLYPGTPYAGETRGVYLDTAPYSRYMLDFKPFGQIQMDGTKFIGKLNLKCKVDVDMITGEAILTISVERGTEDPYYPGDVVIETRRGKVGVEMSIAQVAKDYVAQSVALVQTGAGLVGNAAKVKSAKNFLPSDKVAAGAKLVGDLASGVGSIINNQYPDADISGHNGTSIDFEFAPRLLGYFRYVTAENNEHVGRPLCRECRLGDIPGFIKCAEGDIELPLTDDETAAVVQFLTGGFFLE